MHLFCLQPTLLRRYTICTCSVYSLRCYDATRFAPVLSTAYAVTTLHNLHLFCLQPTLLRHYTICTCWVFCLQPTLLHYIICTYSVYSLRCYDTTQLAPILITAYAVTTLHDLHRLSVLSTAYAVTTLHDLHLFRLQPTLLRYYTTCTCSAYSPGFGSPIQVTLGVDFWKKIVKNHYVGLLKWNLAHKKHCT